MHTAELQIRTPSQEEIFEAIHKLTSNKTLGPDSVTTKILKVQNEVFTRLYKIIKCILETEKNA